MSDFDKLLQSLKGEIETFVTSNVKEHVSAAISDGHQLLDAIKADLEQYTLDLQQGVISKDQFRSNMKDWEQEVEMEASLQAGLAKIRADKIKNGIFDLIIEAVFRFIPWPLL